MLIPKHIPYSQNAIEMYGVKVIRTLNSILNINPDIKNRLDDFLGNEAVAMRWNLQNMPANRIAEFKNVCEILQSNTAEKIVEILDGLSEVLGFGTNENREFLLKRFGLWSGK